MLDFYPLNRGHDNDIRTITFDMHGSIRTQEQTIYFTADLNYPHPTPPPSYNFVAEKVHSEVNK